ncbi:MAG: AMP-binding protein [Saprospiraceae bacterium]|nr:AMP-binding protein [Saprospiraceae bacterium]MCF8249012.1 AMP-binding protein [Saprospiraceae bacterium]MCF8282430.1 AMP-binding protein [Bacteroidales bacterium]MCF8310906.1 AMP-binding protein [Saprospiraceae bacterium]MCF8439506.1 AMP-binding protein [Saprospiraceae bacterium]
MEFLQPSKNIQQVIPNLALMLQRNAVRFGEKTAYQERKGGKYAGISWEQFYEDIENIAYRLQEIGFEKGSKMVLFSQNRLEMLELELAVMASGGMAVPIFYNFYPETAELLIRHSDAEFLAVSGFIQLNRIDPKLPLKKVIILDNFLDERFDNLLTFESLLEKMPEGMESPLHFEANAGDICLNMYTSGTMGIPKCVQLTHQNILSQQAALHLLWNINDNDRFLSYLPWHHSFGGIFELFTALYNGATYSSESSFGKIPKLIMENWRLVKPTVFFSVPKVYEALVELTRESKEAEDLFYNSGLKFVFTAAAPLPEKLSQEFERRGIPVIEGWGLTETSPCCTLTDPTVKRLPGVVGKPIPGVHIRIDEESEIQVKGPNVMVGYYKNDEANSGAFTEDGWYRTGDVGEITETGLKLITRKDRIFKLSNGEKVIPTDMEKLIQHKCHYISFALVSGSGEEYPVALLFPNKKLMDNPDYSISPMDGCFCPRSLDELGRCLQGCLHDANCGIGQKFAKIKAAAIIDDELSVENNTLTPSMKMAPNSVMKAYKVHLDNLYGADSPVGEDVYMIRLDGG